MALIMNLYCGGKDDDVYVDDVRIQVVSVYTVHDFNVLIYLPGYPEGKSVRITTEAVEVLPSVFMFAARNGGEGTRVVVGVDAPRNITILRGKLYRADTNRNQKRTV